MSVQTVITVAKSAEKDLSPDLFEKLRRQRKNNIDHYDAGRILDKYCLVKGDAPGALRVVGVTIPWGIYVDSCCTYTFSTELLYVSYGEREEPDLSVAFAQSSRKTRYELRNRTSLKELFEAYPDLEKNCKGIQEA